VPTLDTNQDITVLGSEIVSNNLKKVKFERALTSTDTS
jgi:hypothetical protein